MQSAQIPIAQKSLIFAGLSGDFWPMEKGYKHHSQKVNVKEEEEEEEEEEKNKRIRDGGKREKEERNNCYKQTQLAIMIMMVNDCNELTI